MLLRARPSTGSLRKVVVVTVALLLGSSVQGCPRAGPGLIPDPPVIAIMDTQPPQITADTACWALIERSADSASLVPMAQNCAEEEDTRRRRIAVGHTSRVMMRTGALFMDIPEFHDEQRLTDGNQGYGPMAYVFAMPTLDGFKDSVQFGSHGARGVLVGLVYVLELVNSPPLPATYTDLSLAYGLNCVYLAFRKQAPQNERWKSYIKPANSDSTCTSLETPDNLLPVNRISVSNNSGNLHPFEDYPAVARFDEAANGRPLLGFKCVDGWCVIGLGSQTVRPPMAGGPGGREGNINGWHDEQVLTIRNAPGDFHGVFRAKLTPRPHLERVTLDTLQNWTHMATITLHTPPVGQKYSTWGMRQGNNRMELRLNPVDSQWQARMIAPAFGNNPEDTTTLRFVGRHSHFDVAVPATARFRWTLADDGIWVPCDLGCCKVEGVAN